MLISVKECKSFLLQYVGEDESCKQGYTLVCAQESFLGLESFIPIGISTLPAGLSVPLIFPEIVVIYPPETDRTHCMKGRRAP